MFTSRLIDHEFEKRGGDGRFLFTPKWNSEINSHRYALTFLPQERRFLLSRQKIESFVTVADEDLVRAFRNALLEEDVAACMRMAINPPPEDDIPF